MPGAGGRGEHWVLLGAEKVSEADPGRTNNRGSQGLKQRLGSGF